MKTFFTHTLLNIPLYIWFLQFLYVAFALVMLWVFTIVHKRAPWEIAAFIIVMIAVNVIWRLALKS